MQVPEHVVSLYVATCGQNGPGLGSDEKEIILLVYVIIEAATGQIIGTKQMLVRPAGALVKDRTVSGSSDASNSAASPTQNFNSSIIYNDNNHQQSFNNNNNNNNNNNSLVKIKSDDNNNGCNAINNCINGTTSSSSSSGHGSINTSLNSSSSSSSLLLLDTTQGELPMAVAQAAGKPLHEAIEEIDEYLRSLALEDGDFKLITDGQLPLRQCLHREACVKDIELPSYYNRFCDLRKEFLQYKSGDLSRALVPVKDVKKILQTPLLPLPQSIAEMMKDLNLTSTEDVNFYIRESRDMVSVIQTMLKAGHKFMASEEIHLTLEPGICSIDDNIDGNCIVRARGLPWQSSDQDIAKFFCGLNVAKGGVALCLSPLGRRNGEALVRFVSQEHRDMALKRHKHHIGSRYIEVYPASGEDFLAIAGGASSEAQAFLSKGAQVIIRMRGLPYDCTAKQVLDFFTTGDKPCNVHEGTEGVLFVKKPDGRATGDAFVLFAKESDAPRALSRHRESIGQRYIELFRSTAAEVQQVLNRSLDPKTYEANHSQPLITQLPTVQLSLLPQHLITSGTTKNCIRLRGLPYEALVEHILHFLDDFAKHIIYQGVHMVINPQGQPSGEAFIQMDSEESARLCAQRKHNQFMVFGKKYRYIEVFQCSGDDMNMVLSGGLQSPLSPHHAHLTGAAKQASLLSPGASLIGSPFGPYFGPPPAAMLTSPHHRPHPTNTHAQLHHLHPHPHTHAHHAAFYSTPLYYWPYPSPPVSPTTYYGQPAAQHQTLYPVEFIPAPAPPAGANFVAAAAAAAANVPAPLSPPAIAIPTPTTNGLIITASKTQTMSVMVPSPKQFSPLPNSLVPPAYATNGVKVPSTAQPHPITTVVTTSASNLCFNPYQTPAMTPVLAPIMNTPTTQAMPAIEAAMQQQSAVEGVAQSSNSNTPVPAAASPVPTPTPTPSATPTPMVNNLAAVVPATATPMPNGTPVLMQNQCVELYIS